MYAIPTVPPGNEVVVIFGVPLALLITISMFLMAFPAAFVALILRVRVSTDIGVPVIAPVDVFKFKPVGRLSLVTDHVIGVAPVAAIV